MVSAMRNDEKDDRLKSMGEARPFILMADYLPKSIAVRFKAQVLMSCWSPAIRVFVNADRVLRTIDLFGHHASGLAK